MHRDEIVLRAAAPNIDEGRIFARLLDRAADGFFRFWLGRNAAEIVARAYLQPNHDLSYQYVIFAEYNERIVGMVSSYSAEQHNGSSDQPLKLAVGRFNIRMKVLEVLLAPLFRLLNTVNDGDFYLQGIAVEKELSGKGIGSALMESAEQQAISHCSKRLVLDVAVDNDGARRLYEHRGMTIESRWPKYFAIPGMSLYRMVKRL